MISVSNITVQFGGYNLFNDLSFIINPKDRIGLAGKNGVGKSTLLKIIAKWQEPTKGSIGLNSEETVGYLPQDLKIESDKTIIEETYTAFEDINKLEKEIEEITNYISESTDYESEEYLAKITELNEKTDLYNHIGGNKKAGSVERILKGLGFLESDFNRNINEFSGGWQMRVELAKLLVISPDYLLLDEPTNHLDMESILWLEDFLKNYPGAIVMVSHDKLFLDNITNRTIEIVFGKIYDLKMNYSNYLESRVELIEHQKATYDNQQKYIAQQERFIERFRSKNTKASQVQSRIKRLEKLDLIDIEELDASAISIKFPSAPRSGNVVLEIKDLSKSYDEKNILNGVNLAIQRGEKIAFVGKNGEGKTTLSKIIAGVENCEGELNIGHNVDIGYYAQIQKANLKDDNTVYETIEREATGDWSNQSRIRGLLGAFLFKNDDIDKKVKVLSGGERSRLALSKLLLKPYNLLILDEPTNHLDISAKEVLKDALNSYDGTLIIVSHDRDFLNGLTSKTYEFKNKTTFEHIGSITDFLSKHKVETFRDFEQTNKSKQKTSKNTFASEEHLNEELSNKDKYLLNKEYEKELKKLKNKVNNLEKEISKLEEQINDKETLMQSPDFYENSEESTIISQEHKSLQTKLDTCITDWENALEELEEKENNN